MEQKPTAGELVLAEGEATGHAHVIDDVRAELRDEGWSGRRFVVVEDGATVSLEHDEHDTLDVPAGIYEIRIQREYTPRGLQAGEGLMSVLEIVAAGVAQRPVSSANGRPHGHRGAAAPCQPHGRPLARPDQLVGVAPRVHQDICGSRARRLDYGTMKGR